MRKATIYILIIEILFFLLGGCAKPVKPVISKNVLTIDKIYSTTGYAKDVFITDNTIYAAQDETGIILFDRESGNILGEMNNDEIKYITLSEEDSVMVGYGDDYFHVYNFTNPDSIFEIGTSFKDDYSRHPHLDYVSAGKDTIKLTFIKSNVLRRQTYKLGSWGEWQPILADNITFSYGTLKNYIIKDDFIILAAGQIGLIVSSYANEDLVITDIEDTPGEALDVKIVDNFAFIADRQEGFEIVDITDVNNLVTISHEDTEGYAQSLDLEANYLAIASGGGGVYLFDVTDKTNPKFLDRIDDEEIGYTYKVVFHNGILYAATRNGIYKLTINL